MRPAAIAAVALGLALAGLFPVLPALAAPMPITIDAWVREASLVVHARSLSAEGPRARFWILEILKGKASTREFEATLLTSSCIPMPDQDTRPPVPDGSEVVLFLAPQEGKGFPVAGQGYAWLRLNDAGRQDVVDGVKGVVSIEALPAPESRMKAYLEAVESANLTLRGTARNVISRELQGKDKAAPWEDRLVALVRSPVLEARLAAIHALRYSNSEKALPALLEAVGDENKGVREGASMALGSYDTEVTVRSLIEAARRPDMVERVIIDLRNSHRAEAGAALVGYLVSADPKLRQLAARSFYRRICEGDPVIRDLHRLVDDPIPEVRVAALDALHKSPLPETVGVLLGALRRKDPAPMEARTAVVSLGSVAGTILDRDGILRALRETPDLPELMEKALRAAPERNLPPVGHAAISILGATGTPGAEAVLRRAQEGEFGPEFVKEATRSLKFLRGRSSAHDRGR